MAAMRRDVFILTVLIPTPPSLLPRFLSCRAVTGVVSAARSASTRSKVPRRVCLRTTALPVLPNPSSPVRLDDLSKILVACGCVGVWVWVVVCVCVVCPFVFVSMSLCALVRAYACVIAGGECFNHDSIHQHATRHTHKHFRPRRVHLQPCGV